ncbi:MAG: hypothetical protein AAF602_14255 [Myxococcota bacterium]
MIPWLFVSLVACRTVAPVRATNAYATAVAASADNPERTAEAAWVYLDAADPDDPRYDRAQRLLAQAAEDLGLTWAAGLLYRDIARARRDVSLLPDAIAGLERLVRAGTYDRDGWIDGFLAADDFGVLPDETTGFVAYHRGLDLVRRREDTWAKQYFGQIPEGSDWSDRHAYLLAIRDLADDKVDDTVTKLTDLLLREDLVDDVRIEATRTLARLAYEQERFDDALLHYEGLRELATEDAGLLLEMAWTHYWLGDARRTLGLLVAMDAPVHAGFVRPERYVLEALAMRRLCQYEAARRAPLHLQQRHGEALRQLRAGTPPHEVASLRDAVRAQSPAGSAPDLVGRMLDEQSRIPGLALPRGVRVRFEELYARGLERARKVEAQVLPEAAARLAEELLAADEGTRLVVHELGVAMLRGRRRPDGAPERPAEPVPVGSEEAYYRFDGEYWTDELDSIVVYAEDRCLSD